MKRVLQTVCMVLAMALPARGADVIYTTVGTLTALPAQNDTVTVNGSVRTFVTNVTAAATQVLIGTTTNATAANWVAQLASYSYTGISGHANGAVVTLVGTQNRTITASKTGSWGTLVTTTNTVAEFTLIVPFSASYNTTGRVGVANLLVSDLGTYPTALFPAAATAFGNFANLSLAQTFSGRKGFGTLDATTVNAGAITESNTAPTVVVVDIDGGVDAKKTTLAMDSAGVRFVLLSDDGTISTNAIELTRSGWAPGILYLRARVFPSTVEGGSLIGNTATNMLLGASAAWVTWERVATLLATGFTGISNTAPNLDFIETDSGTNLKRWRLGIDTPSGVSVLSLQMLTDAGADGSGHEQHVFEISRTSEQNTNANLTFMVPVDFEKGLSIDSGYVDVASEGLRSLNGLIIGDYTVPFPTGSAGVLYFFDGTMPSADPTTGVATGSASGEWMARSSAASEGSGASWRVFNRTGSVVGSGSDYTVTGSMAAVDFGGTDPILALPTAGTYHVFGRVSILTGATPNDEYRFKLVDTGTTLDVPNSDIYYAVPSASTRVVIPINQIVTTTTGTNLRLYGYNASGARGAFEAVRTQLNYVREY